MLGLDLYKMYCKKLEKYDDVFTTQDIMDIVGISETFIFREIKKGHLKSCLVNQT